MCPASAQATLAVTERDHELLLSIYKHRYLSVSQVQRLHFPSAQTATRRLRLLGAAGYVSTFRSPAVPDRLVALARKGAEAVAERLSVPFGELGWDGRRQQPKDYLFLKHFLAANDFRIALTKACAGRGDVRLLGFLPEHLVERTPAGSVQKYLRDVIADVGGPGHKITHTPDAVFALERGDKAALFFLEIDRGTEALRDAERGFLKIVRFYLSYLLGSGYQRYREDFGAGEQFKAFRVLVVTSSPQRLENIRTHCGAVPFDPAHAKRFIWLATEEVLGDETILSRRWASLDPGDGERYAIVA